MAKKCKHKKPQTPRHWRMKSEQRLAAAKLWIPTYQGKSIVSGYRKRFHVDIMCAIRELQKLGIEFKQEYIESVQRNIAAMQRKKQEKKQAEELETFIERDENFAFIVGYTSGGAAYGLTWEQWSEIEQEEEMY